MTSAHSNIPAYNVNKLVVPSSVLLRLLKAGNKYTVKFYSAEEVIIIKICILKMMVIKDILKLL